MFKQYVIQWVIEKGERSDKSQVISKIYGQVLPLAQQKFASNVIEKCIMWATEEERKRLIAEVLAPAADGSSVVKAMLVHPFANYVMQSELSSLGGLRRECGMMADVSSAWIEILHTAVGPQREAVFSQTATQLASLRKYSTNAYSKHLIASKFLSLLRALLGTASLTNCHKRSRETSCIGAWPHSLLIASPLHLNQ